EIYVVFLDWCAIGADRRTANEVKSRVYAHEKNIRPNRATDIWRIRIVSDLPVATQCLAGGHPVVSHAYACAHGASLAPAGCHFLWGRSDMAIECVVLRSGEPGQRLRSFGDKATTEDAVLSGTGKCWTGFCIMGLTLDELADLARAKTSRKVSVFRDLTAEQFLEHLRRSNDISRCYVVNFSRASIFGSGGHHSP